MQVIGEVVRSYIDLRTAQALKANAAHDARAQAEIARLIADRLRVGLASRVDLMRAETQVRGSVAAIPAFASEAARSEESRVGKKCDSTCSSRWSPHH